MRIEKHITNPPPQVVACGEVSYSCAVALELEDMVKRATAMTTEISVARYEELAA